jgi:glycosyltransferase involved in cell wall biosynthesis
VTEESQYPLVTFALFAYNQENYIREAVEAALAQDYPNLEIIISDDCSVDGTLDVIQSIANEYCGAHTLRIVRNETNMGIGPHVSNVGMLASGELVVVAAGDDFSVSERVSRIVDTWCANGKPEGALHSAVCVRHKNGEVAVSRGAGSVPEKSTLEYFVKNDFRGLFFGSAAAYTKSVFTKFLPIQSAFEDVALTFRALLIGRVIYVDGELVKYNINESSVTRPLRIWERSRARKWFEYLCQNIEGMEADYIHFLTSEKRAENRTILRQLQSVKRKRERARGLAGANPFKFLAGMISYPHGVSFRAWLGFYRVFFGFR